MLIRGNISNIKEFMHSYILLYSISYSEGLLRELPYAYYFPERSLCHLHLLSNDKNFLILLLPELINDEILLYHFKNLYQFDEEKVESAKKRLIQICPSQGSTKPLIEDILMLNEVLEVLHDVVAFSNSSIIVNFSPSTKVEKLGEILRVNVQERPESLAVKLGSKSGNKIVLSESKVPTPKGIYDVSKTEQDLLTKCFHLLESYPEIEQLVIKLNDASWGDALGNAIVDKNRLLTTQSLRLSVERALQPWENLVPEIADGGAIVEEYLRGAIVSPSSQGFIDEHGAVSIVSVQEQILVKDQYLGCIAPAPTRFLQEICESIRRIGLVLYGKGVRGSFGVDFLGFDDGRLFATEINIRKVGTSHVISYVESVVGNKIDSSGILSFSSKESVCYVHRRFFEPHCLKGVVVSEVLNALDAQGALYDHSQKCGVILHTLSAIETCGYVEITSVSNTKEGALQIDKKVQSILSQFPNP